MYRELSAGHLQSQAHRPAHVHPLSFPIQLQAMITLLLIQMND